MCWSLEEIQSLSLYLPFEVLFSTELLHSFVEPACWPSLLVLPWWRHFVWFMCHFEKAIRFLTCAYFWTWSSLKPLLSSNQIVFFSLESPSLLSVAHCNGWIEFSSLFSWFGNSPSKDSWITVCWLYSLCTPSGVWQDQWGSPSMLYPLMTHWVWCANCLITLIFHIESRELMYSCIAVCEVHPCLILGFLGKSVIAKVNL